MCNDRYSVEDTQITRRKGKAIYRGVYPVEKIHPWLHFKRSEDDTSSEEMEEDDVSNSTNTAIDITDDILEVGGI